MHCKFGCQDKMASVNVSTNRWYIYVPVTYHIDMLYNIHIACLWPDFHIGRFREDGGGDCVSAFISVTHLNRTMGQYPWCPWWQKNNIFNRKLGHLLPLFVGTKLGVFKKTVGHFNVCFWYSKLRHHFYLALTKVFLFCF